MRTEKKLFCPGKANFPIFFSLTPATTAETVAPIGIRFMQSSLSRGRERRKQKRDWSDKENFTTYTLSVNVYFIPFRRGVTIFVSCVHKKKVLVNVIFVHFLLLYKGDMI
jgi:hypothetical protein